MLEVSVPIAHELLAQCAKQGQALVQRASLVGDASDYESWKSARAQWIEPTVQALQHMYGSPAQAGEFTDLVTAAARGERWQQRYAEDLKVVKEAIDFLTVLQSELAFAREDLAGDAAESELMSGGAIHYGSAAEHSAEPDEHMHDAHDPDPDRSAGTDTDTDTDDGLEAEVSVRDALKPALRDGDGDGDGDYQDVFPNKQREPDAQAPLVPDVRTKLTPSRPVGAELAEHANGSVSAERAGTPEAGPTLPRQILLAHGRNERWMRAVVRVLEQTGAHEVTILNERSSERGALAGQLTERAPAPRYAVVLLTADDIGAPRSDSQDEPYFSPRAHQGVVFEMGFLVAALAPGHVCVLYEEGVQLPCDLEGIAYVRLDLAGTWQPKLLLTLRRAGFDYDLNKLVPA